MLVRSETEICGFDEIQKISIEIHTIAWVTVFLKHYTRVIYA